LCAAGQETRRANPLKARLLHLKPHFLRLCNLERPGVNLDLDAILALEPFRYSPRVPA